MNVKLEENALQAVSQFKFSLQKKSDDCWTENRLKDSGLSVYRAESKNWFASVPTWEFLNNIDSNTFWVADMNLTLDMERKIQKELEKL